MGLRGVGMTRLAAASLPHVRVVGLCDGIRGRAELAARHLQLDAPAFDRTDRMLDQTRPDALLIFTPDAFHVEPAIQALKRGIHVYCEKPMATTLADCDRMIRAARASKAIFYMGFNLRHAPYFRIMGDLIGSGELGEVLTLEMSEHYPGGRTYFRRWNRLKSAGGGLWITKATHDFDVMSWFAGSEPRSVFAAGGCRVFRPKKGAAARCRDCALRWECPDCSPFIELEGAEGAFREEWLRLGEQAGYLPHDACLYRGDIETIDHGMATVVFRNGAVGTYALSVVAPDTLGGRWTTITGTQGTIRADPKTGKVLFCRRGRHAPRVYDADAVSKGGHGGADPSILQDFHRVCQCGEKPIAGWEEGRRAVAVGLAATRSMETGALVRL
jgi:predicted dehydrogenase